MCFAGRCDGRPVKDKRKQYTLTKSNIYCSFCENWIYFIVNVPLWLFGTYDFCTGLNGSHGILPGSCKTETVRKCDVECLHTGRMWVSVCEREREIRDNCGPKGDLCLPD